jgi:type IV secretion system protein VirB4
VLTLLGYPARSWATMMQRLEALDLDFRWCTRWMGIERHLQDGLLHERQKDWLGQEKTPWQWWKESTTKRTQRLINEDATRKTEDLSAARQDIGADIYGLGNFSTTILTWSDTADEADMQVRQIQHTLTGLGFVAKREGDYGSRLPITTRLLQYLAPPHHTAAFLSTHPGNTIDNIRQSLQSTMTMAHLMPGLKAVWAGPEQDEHLQEPPWFLAHTETSSLVRMVSHVRDVGHHMLLGPTGSGKSTMLLFGIAQWLMYTRTQASIFDVGRTARLLTLLLGGEWIDLGAGTLPLQPLRNIDDPAEFRWALEWLLRMVERSGVAPTGIVQSYLAERLKQLAAQPANARTFSTLLRLCDDQTRRVEERVSKGTRDAQGLSHPDVHLRARVELQRDVQRALRPFTRGGEYGHLLDGVQETLLDSHLVVFEQKELLNTPRLLEPVSQFCFHITERRFSTNRPMQLVLEEAALVSILPQYKEKFDAWLMTTRKEGVSIAFVINSLQQAAQLGLGLLTEENCPARFYFPNSEALTPHTAKVYDLFGLTHEEMRLIATARPYHDMYYVCREYGRRLFHLNLSPFIRDCLARNDDADHALMDDILHKEGREGFAAGWLRHHGYAEEATVVEQHRTGEMPCPSRGSSVC